MKTSITRGLSNKLSNANAKTMPKNIDNTIL